MSELLPGFEPSEKDLVNRALAQPLADKIQRSIGLLQMYEAGALKLSPDGYYLAFSGGKDSCVIKQLAIEAGVKFKAWYNLTTIDPPELVWFIKRHHAEVAWNKPKMPMMKKLLEKSFGPPTRMARWCCKIYKEQGGIGHVKIIGVRVSESARRAAMWKEFNYTRKTTIETGFLCPIVYWTDADVWEFIRSRNLPYCELYDQGFSRLGCIGCPMVGQDGINKQFDRWPKHAVMWKKAVLGYYEKWLGVPKNNGAQRYVDSFKSGLDFWEWWISRKGGEGEAQCFQEEMDMNT